MHTKTLLTRFRTEVVEILTGPPILAFLPALTLGAFWLGGELALILAALGLPLIFAFAGAFGIWPSERAVLRDDVTGFLLRDSFQMAAQEIFHRATALNRKTACFMVELDDYDELVDRHGQGAGDLVVQRSGDRILSALRDADVVARISENRFAMCLQPVPQLDLELCIQLAGRVQAAIEDPISLDGVAVYVSCSVGFCQHSRTPGSEPASWVEAAAAALAEARLNAPSSIRAYTADTRPKPDSRSVLRDDVTSALENGQIQPWYQPQISTDTGKVTGIEALARWSHPVRGLLNPDTFLPAVEEAGQLERLGQVMLYHALTALKAWDSAGVDVPRISVNFASDELRNPNLVERVR
ncbi:MAG: EAL domain-containing protein, partial [Pseudomonadota bacterium]